MKYNNFTPLMQLNPRINLINITAEKLKSKPL